MDKNSTIHFDVPSAIAKELDLTPVQVKSVLELFEQGCTVPFIARYRKEATGALDETVAADGWKLVTQQTAEWNAEKAQQIVQSVIDSGEDFNVIYAENDDMAKGAVAALDKANISHGVGKDVIIMGFDCNKWALEELLAQNWNYDGQCNPFQSSYIDEIIKTIESGGTITEKTVIMDEKGFDATTITQEDVDSYGI